MGRRKLTREELVEFAGGGGSGPGTALATRPVDPHALHDTSDVTSLQQTAGNKAATAAVQTLAVQRRGGAASTDAPGVKKKKQEEQVDYAPTARNEKFIHEENGALLERANQDAEATVKNTLYEAAERYEEFWFRTKNRAVGINLAKVYKKIGDTKRAAFWRSNLSTSLLAAKPIGDAKRAAYWQGVATGSIKPGQKRASDGSDQHA